MKLLHTQGKIFVRRSAFDDVYQEMDAHVYTPELEHDVRTPYFDTRKWVAATTMLALLVTSTGLTHGMIAGTGAFFSDSETSSLNRLSATLLDFDAGDAPDGLKVVPEGSSVDIPIVITPVAESVAMNYRITVVQTGGNTDLCTALTGSMATPFAYSGPLLGLNGVAFTNATLTLAVALPGSVPNPDVPCEFDVVFRSWNALVPENTGYSDEERVSVTITDPPAPSAPVVEESIGEIEVPPPAEDLPTPETQPELEPVTKPTVEEPPIDPEPQPEV